MALELPPLRIGDELMPFVRRHWPSLAAAAIVLLLLAEGLVPGRVFFYRDLGTQFWPVITDARAGADGSVEMLPFWTHASTNGRPLLANPGFSFLSPFALLWTVLPHAAAFDLFLVIHALLAAAGMAALARALGMSPESSLCAGLALGLGGGVVSAHNLWWALVALGFAPWVLLAGVRACEAPSAWRFALLAVALALQANGGMPEVVLATLVVGAALSLTRGGGTVARRIGRTALAWGASGLWAIAIASPQLVPAALHARTTLRGYGFKADALLYNSLDPRALPGLVLPRWGGHPVSGSTDGTFSGASWTDSGTPYLLSHYCGLIAALLALFAMGCWLRRTLPAERRGLVAGLTLVALLGVMVALGRHVPPIRMLATELAPLPLRYLVKALFVTFLAVPLLAAAGLDAIAARIGSSRAARATALAIALMAGLDLLLSHGGYTPGIAVSELSEPPLARELKARAEQHGARDGEWLIHHERFEHRGWGPPPGSLPPTAAAMHVWQRRVLIPPLGLAHGIRHAYDRPGDLLDDVRTFESARKLYALPRDAWARGLGDAAVLFVLSPTSTLEEESGGLLVNERALGSDLGVPAGSGFLYRNTAFRPRLEMEAGTVLSSSHDHRGMSVVVSAPAGTRLVVREALGDLGTWTATLPDGRILDIGRAMGSFAAVTVPAGDWTIRLDNVPPGWNASLALSAAGIAGVLAAMLAELRKRRLS